MLADDYALALQLQEEFDSESAVTITNSNADSVGSCAIYELEERRDLKGTSSVIDPSWELIDPNPDARALFLEFNAKYFWGELGGVEVKWSPRMTLCAGVCSYEGRGGMCSIRLSEPLLKLRPRKDLVETLLHEMIHAYLFVTNNDRDRDGHGPEFLKHMHRLNKTTGAHITIYHSFHDEVDSYRRHWWRCDGHCQTQKPFFGYVKRVMNRPPSSRDPWWSDHQRTCGGTFLKIKEPENYAAKKNKKELQEQMKTGENKNGRTAFDGWLQTSSTDSNGNRADPKTSDWSGKKGDKNSIPAIAAAATAATAADVIEISSLSDDELLIAVDSMERNHTTTQPAVNAANIVPSVDFHMSSNLSNFTDQKFEFFDDGAHNVFPGESTIKKTGNELLTNPLIFPGRGIILGQPFRDSQPERDQVLRRLPGIGLIEVRTNLENLQPNDVNRNKPADRNRNKPADGNRNKPADGNRNKPADGNKNKPADGNRNEPADGNRNKDTKGAYASPSVVKEDHESNTSEASSKKFSKAHVVTRRGNDIRSFLSDKTLKPGAIIKIPNFKSVCSPQFSKQHKDGEGVATSLILRRPSTDDLSHPTKRIRLDGDKDPSFVFSDVVTSCDSLNGVSRKTSRNISDVDGTIHNSKNIYFSDKSHSSEHDYGPGSTGCLTSSGNVTNLDESQTIASVINRMKKSVVVTRHDDIPLPVNGSSDVITAADVINVDAMTVLEDHLEEIESIRPNHVMCPVCSVLVDEAAINGHLDDCLR